MNLILALLIGSLIGWIAFALMRFNAQRGMRTSLAIGLVGGGIGMQLAQMLGAAPSVEGQLNVFALVISAAAAGACLIIANMITNRGV